MEAVSSAVARIPVGGRVVLVDEEDEQRVSSISWTLCKAKCGRLYARNGKVGSMARWLMNAPRGVHVDHKNGDTLDNRRSENLRIVTHQQNQWNRKRAPGKSRFKGVTHFKCTPLTPWMARVECNANRHFLGKFPTALAAALAYDDAAAKLFGKYAGLNFPERHRNLGEPNPNALLKSRAQRRWKQWKTA